MKHHETLHTRPLRTLALVLATLLMTALAATAAPLTAGQVLAKTRNAVQGAPSLSVALTVSGQGQATAASLTMAKEKFVYRDGNIEIYYDGKTQWSALLDDREVTVSIPTSDELAESNPFTFLTAAQNQFNVSVKSSTASQYVLEFTPRAKSSGVRRATVTVNASTWYPRAMTVTMSSGTVLNIKVTSVVKGTAIGDAGFRFDAATRPGFEVIDMR